MRFAAAKPPEVCYFEPFAPSGRRLSGQCGDQTECFLWLKEEFLCF